MKKSIPCPCGKGYITKKESDKANKYFQEEVNKEVEKMNKSTSDSFYSTMFVMYTTFLVLLIMGAFHKFLDKLNAGLVYISFSILFIIILIIGFCLEDPK